MRDYRSIEWSKINARWSKGFTPKCATCKKFIEGDAFDLCKRDKYKISYKQAACFNYVERPLDEERQVSIFE